MTDAQIVQAHHTLAEIALGLLLGVPHTSAHLIDTSTGWADLVLKTPMGDLWHPSPWCLS